MFRRCNVRIARVLLVAAVMIGATGCGAVNTMKVNDEMQKGDAAFAKEYLSEAEAHYVQALQIQPGQREALLKLASVRDAQGRYEDARQCYEVALNLQPEDTFKVRDQEIMILTNLPRNLDSHVGDRHEDEFKLAVNEISKRLGDNAICTAPIVRHLAYIHMDKKQYDKAEADAQRFLNIYRATEGEPSVGVAYAHRLLGTIYGAAGKRNEAKREFDTSIAMYKQVLGEDAPQISEVRHAAESVER